MILNPYEILVAAATLVLLPAWIAKRKGRSFAGFYVLGFLAFIVAVPVALLVPDTRRRCAECGGPMPRDARRCPHCQAEVAPAV
jgi:hypothetical protein